MKHYCNEFSLSGLSGQGSFVGQQCNDSSGCRSQSFYFNKMTFNHKVWNTKLIFINTELIFTHKRYVKKVVISSSPFSHFLSIFITNSSISFHIAFFPYFLCSSFGRPFVFLLTLSQYISLSAPKKVFLRVFFLVTRVSKDALKKAWSLRLCSKGKQQGLLRQGDGRIAHVTFCLSVCLFLQLHCLYVDVKAGIQVKKT